MVNIDIPVGQRPRFIFVAHNMGDSPGRLLEVRSATLVLAANTRIPNDLSFPFHEPLNATLASGQKIEVPGNGGNEIVNNEAMEIFAGQKLLLCLGTLVLFRRCWQQTMEQDSAGGTDQTIVSGIHWIPSMSTPFRRRSESIARAPSALMNVS